MKARKMAQTLTALALAATMAAPMTAFAEAGKVTTVTGEEVNKEQSGTTPINLSVTPGYIVTIPAKIDLVEGESEETNETGKNGDEIYTGKGTITVEDVHLKLNQQLEVSVSDDTSFELKDQSDVIEYEVATSNGGSALKAGQEIQTFDSKEGPNVKDSQEVYFKTASPVTDAGNFTGNITFTFSVIGPE